ncbi:MAG: hypothetical protein QXI93_01580 [Candidatus Methanomethylicia archaeon]
MNIDDVLKYYLNDAVKGEIVDYCRMRWVAVEAKGDADKRVFFRYWWKNGPPLAFKDESSLERFLKMYRSVNFRSFYASINIYDSLKVSDDVSNIDNIGSCTPVWDIDGSLNNIKLTLDTARIILDFLDKWGIHKSVYLKWSGRGLHIHIHEKAVSKDVLSKIHPLDVAYSIVEYTILKCWDKIRSLASNISNLDREFKVENKIDIQRVFTCPLSLHREHDIAAVCFKPDDIGNFDLSWTNPSSFKHDRNWRIFVEGEVDALALEAYGEVGGYIPKMGRVGGVRRSNGKLINVAGEIPVIRGSIGRFQVMALLQAARHYVLRGDLDKAKSFGLNRAIFYAWAKYYKPRYSFGQRSITGRDVEEKYTFDVIGDERVPISSNGYYTIGDTIQTPSDFDREIANKINSIISFNIAWESALDYIKRFSKETLESQQEFYKRIYEPIRDNFTKVIQEYLAFKKYEK